MQNQAASPAQRVKTPLHTGSAPLPLSQMLAGKGKNKSPAAAGAWLRDGKCAGQMWGTGLCSGLRRGGRPKLPAAGLGGDVPLDNTGSFKQRL